MVAIIAMVNQTLLKVHASSFGAVRPQLSIGLNSPLKQVGDSFYSNSKENSKTLVSSEDVNYDFALF
jgi:hypothetical protein